MTAEKKDKHGVVAHTPNAAGYSTGDNGTIIPRADADGLSRGISRGAGVVVVDPSLSGGGGTAVDMGSVTPEMSRWAFAEANKVCDDPEERTVHAYKLLAQKVGSDIAVDQPTPIAKPVRENPVMPGYVVPMAAENYTKKDATMAVPEPRENLPVLPAKLQVSEYPAQREPPASAPADPVFVDDPVQTLRKEFHSMVVVLNAMVASQNQLVAKLSSLDQPPRPHPQPATVAPEPPPNGRQPEGDVEEKLIPKTQVVSAITKVFDSLGIPGLGPEPLPPKMAVRFDLGDVGKQTAKYHWAIEHGNGLFLIYDTRFQYGSEYEPPYLGPERTITVDIPSTGEVYRCYSMGHVNPFGCFSIINLVIADRVEAPTPTDNQDDGMAGAFIGGSP